MLVLNRRTQLALLAVFLLVQPAETPVLAELAFFRSGAAMSVAGYRVDGSTVVLFLRNGGLVTCERTLLDRIEPDEMPAEAEAAPVPVAPSAPKPLRTRPYSKIIQSVSQEHGVNPDLVHALIQVESGYQANARSPKGAMGLMQLMPETVVRYSVKDPFDPVSNIRAGTRHLKKLLDKFGVHGALAAYNAGEGVVRKFQGVPPYRETQRFVSRILEIMNSLE